MGRGQTWVGTVLAVALLCVEVTFAEDAPKADWTEAVAPRPLVLKAEPVVPADETKAGKDPLGEAVLPPGARMAETGEPANSGHLPSYLLSSKSLTGDRKILWTGFLTGMRGFEGFAEPIGNPIYFENPIVGSELKLVYIWHEFPEGGVLSGGDASLLAYQLSVALTERLAFVARKSGYTWLRADALKHADGWNDFAIGLKYALLVDRARQFVLTTGLRWEWENGNAQVLQGHSQELSPFFSVGKGWGRFHTLGNVTGRIPVDRDDGNHILSWDLHFDYELCPKVLPGFYPVFEVHGLHYLRSGDRICLRDGGLDFANLGSNNVAGSFVIWGGIGFRWKLTPNFSVGSTWEFPFHNPDTDSFNQRVTVDVTLTW